MQTPLKLREPDLTAIALKIIESLLGSVNDLDRAAECLASTLKGFIEADCIVLIKCQTKEHVHAHCVASAYPASFTERALSETARKIYTAIHDIGSVSIINRKSYPKCYALLEKSGFGDSLGVPLNVGTQRVGYLLLLGVCYPHNPEEAITLLKILSLPLSLIFSHFVHSEQQENIIAKQTEHLSRANSELERRMGESEQLTESANRSRLALLDSLEDRNFAEKQLRASEERFRSLYNSMNEGVALHRVVYNHADKAVDYIIESVNPAYERILSLKPGDVQGKLASVAYGSGTGGAPYLDIYAGVAETRQPAHFEIKHEPTGKILKISVSSPGKGLFATVFEDISETRQMTDQLEKIQRMESIGRLAGGVAHDFNNMLSVILGNLEMALEETPECDKRYHDLIEIRKAAQRSAKLTRQMLAFARRQTITPRIVDINTTLDGMIDMMKRLLGEDISLVWLPSDNLWPIKIDPSQIDQILANLCVNARDAIKGVGRLTIKTANATITETYCKANSEIVPGDYVTLVVNDNGCGMSKDVMRHLFEPFFTTKHMGIGSGLGLATVYGIVKQNKGFINVYSEPGHGTTFKIGIPRNYGDAEESHPGKSSHVVGSVQLGNETILLVEDESSILSMIQTMLEKLGYHVLAAASPHNAIELARNKKGAFKLLLSDVIMPEMDGLELAKRLKSDYPGIHCLFMSGYTAEIITNLVSEENSTDFIQKPFSIQDLSHKVREVLDR